MIGNIQAIDGMPILRMRPALIASRKLAPPASAARAITPLPPAIPSLNYNFILASYSYWPLINVEFKWSAP